MSPADEQVRIAVVQYRQRRITGFEAFAEQLTQNVKIAADYAADVVVLPELVTLQLLSIAPKPVPARAAVTELDRYTGRVEELLSALASSFGLDIVGGTHLTRAPSGATQNVAYIALRDGSLHAQAKLHPTPNERACWGVEGGDRLEPIATAMGPIGVLVCYDIEFPEAARRLADQGVRLLFVPFCTDDRLGYLRVRYCAQARAIENQLYVALAGNCGLLRGVENADVHYAQSCVLTPCDVPFAREGIAVEATPDAETVVVADVRLDALDRARRAGTVRNLSDRRDDLYDVAWRGPS